MTDQLREALLDETDPIWTDVEKAIWPDGPAHGHGSGAYAALKAKIVAAIASPSEEPGLDVEFVDDPADDDETATLKWIAHRAARLAGTSE